MFDVYSLIIYNTINSVDMKQEDVVVRIPGESPSSASSLSNDLSNDVPIIEKSSSPLRWPMLVLACLMLIGSYYRYFKII